MADARVSDQRLKDAFAAGVADVWDEYLVGVEDRENATVVLGVSEALRVATKLLSTLADGERIFIEKRKRKITTHDHAVQDEDDAPSAEVIDVSPAD